MDERQIDQFLAFGFVAQLPPGDPLAILSGWSQGQRRDESAVSEAVLVREGVRALRAAFDECASRFDGSGEHVVFLSGGLDSRTVLGALLDSFRPAEVCAATFGLPGEWDFDLAVDVAKLAGVRHELLESFSVDWSTDGLVDSALARQLPFPFPFGQRYLSFLLHKRMGPQNAFWDGLCGDAVGGKGQAAGDEGRWTWETAIDFFLPNNLLKDWKEFASAGFRPATVMPPEPFWPQEVLSYPDQLNYAIRQTRRTATRKMRGYTVLTPFLAAPWLDFMFSVPASYHQGIALFRAIQQEAYPRLFTLPTTYDVSKRQSTTLIGSRTRTLRAYAERGAGRLGWRPAPTAARALGANQALRRSLRERPRIRELVESNVSDLARRDVVPGVTPDALAASVVQKAISDRRLGVLLGLEVNLKAEERLATMTAGGSTASAR